MKLRPQSRMERHRAMAAAGSTVQGGDPDFYRPMRKSMVAIDAQYCTVQTTPFRRQALEQPIVKTVKVFNRAAPCGSASGFGCIIDPPIQATNLLLV